MVYGSPALYKAEIEKNRNYDDINCDGIFKGSQIGRCGEWIQWMLCVSPQVCKTTK